MDWITGMQEAIDYIEENLTQKLDYDEIARQSFSSSYHFQRTFSILLGYTLGEYIRCRRLALAGIDLASTKEKVIDIAGKYGYESPDSFTKAFCKFHGITPSAAREPGAILRSFAPLKMKIILEGGQAMNYRIEEKAPLALIGHKLRCAGSPTNPEVKRSETFVHWTTTRTQQQMLKNIRCEPQVWYDVYSDFTDEGFSHYIAVQSNETLLNRDFERIYVPGCLYAVFETAKQKSPDDQWLPLIKQIVSEWLPSSGYLLASQPQINKVIMDPDISKRFIEIWIPIEKKL